MNTVLVLALSPVAATFLLVPSRAQALAELYIHLGGGMGGADWAAEDGTRTFHFQVLRRR